MSGHESEFGSNEYNNGLEEPSPETLALLEYQLEPDRSRFEMLYLNWSNRREYGVDDEWLYRLWEDVHTQCVAYLDRLKSLIAETKKDEATTAKYLQQLLSQVSERELALRKHQPLTPLPLIESLQPHPLRRDAQGLARRYEKFRIRSGQPLKDWKEHRRRKGEWRDLRVAVAALKTTVANVISAQRDQLAVVTDLRALYNQLVEMSRQLNSLDEIPGRVQLMQLPFARTVSRETVRQRFRGSRMSDELLPIPPYVDQPPTGTELPDRTQPHLAFSVELQLDRRLFPTN